MAKKARTGRRKIGSAKRRARNKNKKANRKK
jgi:hypothetical protein